MQDIILQRKHFKSYFHFDNYISYSEKNSQRIKEIALDEEKFKKYQFMPFIRCEMEIRKFKKLKNFIEENKIKNIPKKGIPRKNIVKVRLLTYCSHKDALIFAIYRFLLMDKYEKFIRENNIENNVIAYRKIKINQENNKCKSNINFAAEAFLNVIEYTRKYNNCVVLTFDISKFFDNMEHKFLFKQLCSILEVDKLDYSWSKIFHNITKFYYVNKKDIKTILENNKIEPDLINKTFFPHIIDENGKDLHTELYRKFIINKNILHKNNNGVGIPQGSPISDVLANIYLNKFDICMHELEIKYQAFYRRYCDDIIFICKNKDDANKIQETVISKIKEQTTDNKKILEINKDKTTISYFINVNGKVIYDNIKDNNKLTYLGFELSENNVLIKAASLSKRLRKTRNIIKIYINDCAYKSYCNKQNFIDNLKLSKLYRALYSKKDRRDDGRTVKYVFRAMKIFDDLNEKQLKLKYSQIRNTKKYVKEKIKKFILLCQKKIDNGYYAKQEKNNTKNNSNN